MVKTNYCSGNHILVGLGGTGGKILRAFKMRMFEEFPTAEERRKLPVQILYVDSTDEMMPKDGRARADFRVMGQDASFTNNEFFNIKAVDVEYILDHVNNYPSVKRIVENAQVVKSAIGALGQAAGQKRRAGRLLFAANAQGYVNAIRNTYARCEEISTNAEKTTFYIFAGLCGGTGSGSIIDAIVQTRKAFPNSKILVFAMIPERNLPKTNMDQGRYYQNGYAALNELNALQSGRWNPQDVTGVGEAHVFNHRIKGVADGLTIYSNVNDNGLTINSLTELPRTVSDYVFSKIFFINDEDAINEDIVRAYNYENMDDFAYEYDELANDSQTVARTKKINSFGIKRVMYPELRILKHITYTVGESVLYQFKFNNWDENKGYVNIEKNMDYRAEYITENNLAQWMIDEQHLTLELKILPSDADYPRFNEYWHEKAINYAEEAKKANCPLNELDNIMGEFFKSHFRDKGVEAFYDGKRRAIPEMAKEVRHGIETFLFDRWKQGDVSIVELQKVSKLLLEYMNELRSQLDKNANDETDNYNACDQDRSDNVAEWSRLGILQRMVGVGAHRYAEHQNILIDYYTSKTMLVALDFAKELAAKIQTEVSKMDADIAAFAQKINDAIEETEKLVTAQSKVNKGLEDMRGAIVEVSEEEKMSEFEVDIRVDKVGMPEVARRLREAILPEGDFISFGDLTSNISIDEIKDAFDVKLSQIIKEKHGELAVSEDKVLGLNILTQLQQKLKTDDDIKAFASKIMAQSGMYLILNNDQVQMSGIRNNEDNLSATNPASRNKKEILISIPSPEDKPGLVRFADKLEQAFKASIQQANSITNIKVNRKSIRKDELTIVTVGYCFPMRAIDWLSDYKQRYEQTLNSGNPSTDERNAILLHSEGDGKNLPSLFVVDNAYEIAAAAQNATSASPMMGQPSIQTTAGPSMPPTPPSGGPGMPPPPVVEKEISVHLYIGGQQYGPYNRATCKQLVENKQLTEQTMVWMEGMANWQPAGQVADLKSLFAPQMPPPMPGVPPMPGMPPMPPTM